MLKILETSAFLSLPSNLIILFSYKNGLKERILLWQVIGFSFSEHFIQYGNAKDSIVSMINSVD